MNNILMLFPTKPFITSRRPFTPAGGRLHATHSPSPTFGATATLPSSWFLPFLGFFLSSFALLKALKHQHAHSLIALRAGTLIQSVGIACLCLTHVSASILLQAMCFTAAAVSFLTCYTFWVRKRRNVFIWIQSLSLIAFMASSILVIFFPSFCDPSILRALLFYSLIVYHTDRRIMHPSDPDPMLASLHLYVDILINLFLNIIQILQKLR
ncbi:hypothetical protein Tsubulata_019031 [Turnera subulata]|uniref:Uncharacterized protein n=1 Tax=Turnera subulata TaxID=218843 RepID=A0A9Q0FZR5_9ROSI|nr:hypothetical protein Tsubulata_019031 [Turnera subulata]